MDIIDFHRTTTKELLAIKDRVRHLIKHWGEDGKYQEVILKSVMERFLPEKYCITSGFVIKQTNRGWEHDASTQIDIIVYDKNFPILFMEGDFAIVTADSVKAIIEVKANLRNQRVENVIRKVNEVGQFVYIAKKHDEQIFNGIFSYAGYERLKINNSTTVQNAIQNAESTITNDDNKNKFKVNHISFNKDIFYKYWNQNSASDGGYLYKIDDLSFSFLISNLIEHLTPDSVFPNSKLWFPVDKSLRSQRI